ncbi:prepilin-type N-terminal cleavage/methylation domain-containing protein [Caloramator sp. CAR-1]|uniref:type II secretion system protein n=1 Tax=Caloramator sp. CAR-1 TaxID=3062777 RepID=UPI0026E3A874|nr:prepilin-type N-terminal cleavage/methylation domain-containing protein [Caloramator sp. CAR-1]MDO6354206.1 prepilin-type N-terminal cleavage/methylation domain-containing protein [Caloramator sp. CAR-1]
MEKRKKKGFTLIEMIVVLAIIAILAGIAVPQALNSINKSKSTADIANAKALAGAITQGLANGDVTLTSNSWTDLTQNTPQNLIKYINSIPTPKKVSGHFYYYYDGNQLKIGVSNGTNNYIELYPNPDSNY